MLRRSEAGGLLALALLAFVSKSSALAGGFLNWDDLFVLVNNRAVRSFDLPALLTQVTVGIHHPVTLLSFAVEHRLFGLSPLPFHATNVLLHTANALLVAAFALRIAPAPAAWLAAALFAVHPLHVESVAWISERKDLLCVFFYLAALLAWLRFGERRRAAPYLACLGLVALALLSKPMAVTAPLALLALDHWRGRRDVRALLLEKLPFLGLALAAGLRNLSAQAPEHAERFAIFQLGLAERLALGARSLVFYTAKLVWPHPQSAYYDIDRVGIEPHQVLLAALALGWLGFAAWRGGARGNSARLGLLFYLVALAPVLKVVPFGGNSVWNDRYTYLPSVGFLLAAAQPLARLPSLPPARRVLLLGLCAALVAAGGWRSFERCRVWRSSESLWSDVLATYPGTSMALNHLGLAYLDEAGDTARARDLFEQATRARPEAVEPWINLGRVHRERGELERALAGFEHAIGLAPQNAGARIGRAAVLTEMGRAREAVPELRAVLAAEPDDVLALHNLGVAQLELGEIDDARTALERALRLAPRLGAAHAALGDVHRRAGRPEAARGAYRAARLLGIDVSPALLAPPPQGSFGDSPHGSQGSFGDSPHGSQGSFGDSPQGRANVLLITVDTLRADHLGAYGFPLETSPNIDALARGGVLFERAIAAASVTAPAHASILTSRYVREHSVGWMNGPTRLEGGPTLAERFRAAGYTTAGFVGNLLLQRRLGFDQGFEHYDDELPRGEPNRPLSFERIAEQTGERVLAWLRQPRTRPFLLWVHLQDPHGPYTAPAGWAGRFAVPPGPGERPLRVLTTDFGMDGVPAYQALEGVALPSEYRSRYADEIGYADHWVGAIVEAVDAVSPQGAVVLLTADHGESQGEVFRFFAHGHSTTPQVAHVPFVLRAPGLAPGRRRELVSHVDVLPTLLELARLEPLAGASGIALGPFLRRGEPLPDRIVYCDVGRELSAYRGDGFVRVRGGEPAWASPEAELSLTWSMYAWSGGARFERARLDAGLRDAVRAYARRARPMAEAPPLELRDAERLRALGYVID